MDVFHILNRGVNFSKKRFKEDYQPFEQSKNGTPDLHSTITNNYKSNPQLDFFSKGKSNKSDISNIDSEEKNKKKRKCSEPNFDDDHDEEEIVTFKSTEEMHIFRKRHGIKVKGTDVPQPITSFGDLYQKFKCPRYLRQNIKELGFLSPTPIQMQTLPLLLKGTDVLCCAPTGSGKTFAFILPILLDLEKPSKEGFRAVIIAPTRELAQQIHRESEKVSEGSGFKFCLLSKSSLAGQVSNPDSKQQFDVLITTPLRLVYGIKEEKFDFSKVRHLVLDEADKLLQLGFVEQVDEILAACSSFSLRTSMFSATLPPVVESLCKTVLRDPVRVFIGKRNAATETIKQKLEYVGNEQGKKVAITNLLQGGLKPPVLVFVETIDRAKSLYREIALSGMRVDVIHSDRTQGERDDIIKRFRSGELWVLIATDLLGRGIDFKNVRVVINYDFPTTSESYIHRIGRTGRAGREGEAITYVTKKDGPFLKKIVNVMRDSGCEVPEWMLLLKSGKGIRDKRLKRRKSVAPKTETTKLETLLEE